MRGEQLIFDLRTLSECRTERRNSRSYSFR